MTPTRRRGRRFACATCGERRAVPTRWSRCEPCQLAWADRGPAFRTAVRALFPALAADDANGGGLRAIQALAYRYVRFGVDRLLAATDQELLDIADIGPKRLALLRRHWPDADVIAAATPRDDPRDDWSDHAAMVAGGPG